MFLYFHCQLMFPYVNNVQEILFYIQYGIINVIDFFNDSKKYIFIHTIVIYSVKIHDKKRIQVLRIFILFIRTLFRLFNSLNLNLSSIFIFIVIIIIIF